MKHLKAVNCTVIFLAIAVGACSSNLVSADQEASEVNVKGKGEGKSVLCKLFPDRCVSTLGNNGGGREPKK